MAQKIHSAMVFAAGEGQRMRPLTLETPKPLLKVKNKALLTYSLEQLIRKNVSRIVINGCYLKSHIQSYIKALPEDFPCEVIFSPEAERLETGGGVVKALPELGKEPFFAANADIIWLDEGDPSALSKMEEFWCDGMRALMLLVPVEEAIGYEGEGDVDLAADGTIIVPDSGEKKRYVFTGVQILSPSLFDGAEEARFSLYRDWVFPRFRLESGRVEGVYGIVHTGRWIHVGTPEQLAEAAHYVP